MWPGSLKCLIVFLCATTSSLFQYFSQTHSFGATDKLALSVLAQASSLFAHGQTPFVRATHFQNSAQTRFPGATDKLALSVVVPALSPIAHGQTSLPVPPVHLFSGVLYQLIASVARTSSVPRTSSACPCWRRLHPFPLTDKHSLSVPPTSLCRRLQ
jgi:hypothetical protein